jgi:haloalkane dehalogenase
MIDALRTDDTRFDALSGWPYRPNYIDDLVGFEGLRMHFVDEGPADGEVFLCLHGEPTWSYLYRRMMPVFLDANVRVVAPDFFGFGRSDKPVADEVYTWTFHRNSLLRFVEALDLRDITLVVQDWGGLLGLTLPIDIGDRIGGLLIMNTGLAVGVPPSDGFIAWRDYVARTPDLAVGKVIARGTPHLTEAEVAAYDAPFPGPEYKAGVRRFPMDGADVSRAAARWWSEEFTGKAFMAIGMQDPVLGPEVMNPLRRLISGCPEPMEIEQGGHFVQEWGQEIAEAALETWGHRDGAAQGR